VGCSGTQITGANGTAIGTGNQNTIDIMAGCATAGIAARLCGDLVLNGYSDWYLPSNDELYQLNLQKTAFGGFYNYLYWSSTESNDTANSGAWAYDLNGSNGGYPDMDKTNNLFYVRAIRSF